MKAFEQKNVYLVGGSSGIGLAAGRELAKRGANILVMARRENLLKQAVETFQQHAAFPRTNDSIRSLWMSATQGR
jgi:3-dehydrosphinganine reductase